MGVQLLAATVTLTYFIYYTHTWMSRHQFQTYSPSYSFTDEPQVFWSWDERTTGASSYIYISKTCSHYLYPLSVPTRCINLFTRKTLWKQLIKKFDFDWLHLLLLRIFASCAVNCRFIKFSLSLWHFTEKKKKKKTCLELFVPFLLPFLWHSTEKSKRHATLTFKSEIRQRPKCFLCIHTHPELLLFAFSAVSLLNTRQLQISVTKRKTALTVMKLEKNKT